jgi:hypothetical protein
VKILRATEEMVHVCEPEAGINLSDEEKRSSRDLIECQVGRYGLSNSQVGNRKRSSEGLLYFRREVLKVQISRRALRWDRLIS